MVQGEKELLIRDLCSRLPYGVILNCCNMVGEKLTAIDENGLINHDYDIDEVKPCLFPMSSMTDKQKEELKYLCNWGNDRWSGLVVIQENEFCMNTKIIDWLNKNHFDFRNLIGRGLAIDATGFNIY